MYRPFIRYQPDPEPARSGRRRRRLGDWSPRPGHADGQVMLLRDGVLVAADHLLDRISPTVGLWPRSRPDPLGDYLGALERDDRASSRTRRARRARRADRRSGRARRELVAHHRERLEATAAALGNEPRSAYEVSFPLFGDDLKPSARRFAVAETLSHLERLVHEGAARRHEAADGVTYTSA